jgi:hypothetical protein
MRCLQVSNIGKGRCLSFRLQRESNYLRRRKRQYLLPPSTIQRETTIDPVVLVDLVSPVDVPRDIAVGHKRPSWG